MTDLATKPLITQPTQPTEPTQPQAPAPGSASPVPADSPRLAEGSLRSRFVTLLTPVFTVLAGYLAGLVGKYLPGLHLDPGELVAFMVAASTSAFTAALKWMHGWQQHERLVAAGEDRPVRPVVVPPAVAAVATSGVAA